MYNGIVVAPVITGIFDLCTDADSFPVATYLFFKGDERPGRNDVKVAGQAGKGERKVGLLSIDLTFKETYIYT